MNFLPFFMYWLISKDSGTNLDLCKNDTNGEVGICLSRRLCVSEANGDDIGKCKGVIPENVCCKVTLDYSKNATFDQVLKIFLTLSKEGNGGNIILHPVHSFSQYTRPFSANYLQESVSLDFSGNFQKSVYLSAKYGNYKEKQINPARNPEKALNFNSTHDFRKSFLVYKRDFRKSADLQGKDILQNFLLHSSRHNRPYILRSDTMNSYEKLHEVYRPQNMINLTEVNETDHTNTLLRSVQVESTNDHRRSVDPELGHSLHIPTWIESTHDLREAVQLDQSHDMRKPVQTVQTHNLRRPVQTDPTHNLRKIVQSDPTHDLRKPVETDPTYYQRKPVRLMESHDLRWPVVEEVDHDLRNKAAHEEDIFRSSLRDTEMNKILNSFLQNKSEDGIIEKEIDQLLYEDEFLNSQCNHDYPVTTDNTTNDGSLGLRETEMQNEYRKMFNNSLKACGIQFNSTIQESTEERNSNSWSWMVSIQEFISNRFWHKCSGSLINSLWVITAAHCMESRPKWDFLLHLGSTDPDVTKRFTERLIDKISIHPKFNNLNFDHDIALLRMNSPVVFRPDIVPVCLPRRVHEMERKMAVVLGWRLASEKRVNSSRLQEKNVPVLTNRECEIMFSETGSSESIQTSFLCAGFEDKLRESCNGDSGGPLAILDTDGRWSLGGLYSWGKTCSSPNQPEVYIRVSRYARWIGATIACYENNMKPKL